MISSKELFLLQESLFVNTGWDFEDMTHLGVNMSLNGSVVVTGYDTKNQEFLTHYFEAIAVNNMLIMIRGINIGL